MENVSTHSGMFPYMHLDKLADRVERYNADMSKRGIDANLEFEVERDVCMPTHTVIGGMEVEIVDVTLTLTGEAKIGDYTLIGMAEAGLVQLKSEYVDDADKETFTYRSFSDVDLVDDIDPARCDACGEKRNRNSVIVVADADGNQLHLGGSCVKDYLGHGIEGLTSWTFFGDILEIDDEEMIAYCGDPRSTTAYILELAAVEIAKRGYNKADKGFDSTKERVLRQEQHGTLPSQESDIDPELLQSIMDDMIEWASKLEPTSDFERSIRDIGRSYKIDEKLVGIACYIPVAYQREVERFDRLVEQAASVKPLTQEGRMTIEGTIEWCGVKDTSFGATMKMRVKDARGFIVYGTMPAPFVDADLEAGCNVKFDATVTKSKDEEHFGWFKQPKVIKEKTNA
jgi:hypothetical protein